MRCLHFLLVSMGVTFGANRLSAQTTLAWHFRVGDAFEVEQRITQTTALEVKNKPFKHKSDMTLLTRWQVKDAGKDFATLAITVGKLTSKTSTGDGKTALASKEDDLWRGAEFVVTVDPSGRLRTLTGNDELLKKLAADSPQRLKILSALKPPGFFQAIFQDVLGPLSERPVRQGSRWQQAAVDSMSIFGSLLLDTEFTYEGPRDGLHAIASATKTTYKAPRYAIENDVFRILKGEVKTDNGMGNLLFDAKAGRMRRVEKTINAKGNLTLETLQGTQRVEFTTATEVRVEVK